MLLDLSDLVAYTEALAKRSPGISRRVKIDRPGLATDVFLRLSVLSLPPIYASCIRNFDLFGVAVGYFLMWPGSVRAGNMAESLLSANQGELRGAKEVRSAGLLVVGLEEANLICVGRADSSAPDAVHLFDLMRSPFIEQQSIAPDFEKFLLLAGNLHEISSSHRATPAEAISEMAKCCDHFHCGPEQSNFWRNKMVELVS